MNTANLECYTRRGSSGVELVLEGTLDLESSPLVNAHLEQYLASHGPDGVVDTSRLNFIDSKGLGALIRAARQSREAGGTLYLRSPAAPVLQILDVCGAAGLFPPPPHPITRTEPASEPGPESRAARPRRAPARS